MSTGTVVTSNLTGAAGLAMLTLPIWLDLTKPGVGTNRYAYAGNDPLERHVELVVSRYPKPKVTWTSD